MTMIFNVFSDKMLWSFMLELTLNRAITLVNSSFWRHTLVSCTEMIIETLKNAFI